jgi:hypothetical protein
MTPSGGAVAAVKHEKAPRLREGLFLGEGLESEAPFGPKLLSQERAELRSKDGSETRPHTSIYFGCCG